MANKNETVDPKLVSNVFSAVSELIKALEPFAKSYGLIHKRARVEINGSKGDLVWDYIFYNEITFRRDDGKIKSLCTSPSDEVTNAVWDWLIGKYGIEA